MQKGLDLLLKKYSVSKKAELSLDGKTLAIDGKEFPVLPYENERRFIELRNLVLNKRLGNMCTYRIGSTSKKGSDLFEMLKREIGILEFTINSTVKEIFAKCVGLPDDFTVNKVQNVLLREMRSELVVTEAKGKANTYSL